MQKHQRSSKPHKSTKRHKRSLLSTSKRHITVPLTPSSSQSSPPTLTAQSTQTTTQNTLTPQSSQIPADNSAPESSSTPPRLPPTRSGASNTWLHLRNNHAPSKSQLTPTPMRYNGNHVTMISSLLTNIDSESPWDHQRATFAHPGLVFFLNTPYQSNQYEYTKEQVGPQQPIKHLLLRVNSLELFDPFQTYPDPSTQPINDPQVHSLSHSTSVPPGFSNHFVYGGAIHWKEPISVHSQRLLSSHLPTQPPSVQIRKKYSKQNDQHDSSTNTNNNTSLKNKPNDGKYLSLTGLSVISSPDMTIPYIMRKEHHGFFPDSDALETFTHHDVRNYNQQVTNYNTAMKHLSEIQSQHTTTDSTTDSTTDTTTNTTTTALTDSSIIEAPKSAKKATQKEIEQNLDSTNTNNTTNDITPPSPYTDLDNFTCLPYLTPEDVKELFLQEQLAIPNDQIEKIKGELNALYAQLHHEFLSVQKPTLTGLSFKQQYGYLYSSIGSILKRRFKKSLEYDWKWTNQRVSYDTIAEFNANTQNNHLLLHDVDYALSKGFKAPLISPHFFAFLSLEYLGIVSKDTTPSQPGLWPIFEEKIIEVQKQKAKIEYKEYKEEKKKIDQMVDTHRKFMETVEEQLIHEYTESSAANAALNISTNDGEKIKSGKNQKKIVPVPPEIPQEFLDTEQMLLHQQSSGLAKDEQKSLLKQRLEVQPWHTIYQQLINFEYFQRRPFPAPQQISIVTNTSNSDQFGSTTTTTTTKQESIIYDVYAKVLTEHESLRNRVYHSNIRKKILTSVMNDSKKTKKMHDMIGGEGIENENENDGMPFSLSSSNGTKTTSPTATATTAASNALSDIGLNSYDPAATVLLTDLIRQGAMQVKIWIEGTPLITTTIKTTTQRPKVRLPDLDDDDDDDDLDIFNKEKQKKRAEKLQKEKDAKIAVQIPIPIPIPVQSSSSPSMNVDSIENSISTPLATLSEDTINISSTTAQQDQDKDKVTHTDKDNLNNPDVIQVGPKRNRKIDEEYLYPSTIFEVSNIALDPSVNQDLTPHDTDSTSVVTETIEQEEYFVDVTQERFQLGTVYFEGFATFDTPHLNICGLKKAELEKLLISIQKDIKM